jgi:hypothetical protein
LRRPKKWRYFYQYVRPKRSAICYTGLSASSAFSPKRARIGVKIRQKCPISPKIQPFKGRIRRLALKVIRVYTPVIRSYTVGIRSYAAVMPFLYRICWIKIWQNRRFRLSAMRQPQNQKGGTHVVAFRPFINARMGSPR